MRPWWTRRSPNSVPRCWTRTAPAPDLSAIPEAAALWQATHAPSQQRVARELILADPLAALPAYRGRALVVSAANDAQVPGSDADGIFAALGSDPAAKTRVTIADANHVYKSETRAPSTISQEEILAGYADDGHALADGLVDAIVAFVTATIVARHRGTSHEAEACRWRRPVDALRNTGISCPWQRRLAMARPRSSQDGTDWSPAQDSRPPREVQHGRCESREHVATVAATGGPPGPMATQPRADDERRGKARMDMATSLPR